MKNRLIHLPQGTGSVMLVDDSRESITFFKIILEATGYTIVGIASDGEEAIKLLEHLPTLPDLIISDHMMPRMTGIELWKYLQSTNVYQDIPFLLTSPMSYKPFIRDALASAEVDLPLEYFVELPMLPHPLLEKIAFCISGIATPNPHDEDALSDGN